MLESSTARAGWQGIEFGSKTSRHQDIGGGLWQSPLFPGRRASWVRGPPARMSSSFPVASQWHAAPGPALTAVSPLRFISKRLCAPGACGPEVCAPRNPRSAAQNSCHWRLGAAFREDHCRLRVGDASKNVSLLHGGWCDFAEVLARPLALVCSIGKDWANILSLADPFRGKAGFIRQCQTQSAH